MRVDCYIPVSSIIKTYLFWGETMQDGLPNLAREFDNSVG